MKKVEAWKSCDKSLHVRKEDALMWELKLIVQDVIFREGQECSNWNLATQIVNTLKYNQVFDMEAVEEICQEEDDNVKNN